MGEKMVSEVDLERYSAVLPVKRFGRRPTFYDNMDMTRINHGKWRLVSGTPTFSGGILHLYDVGAASELRSDGHRCAYGTAVFYAKLDDANSIIGFDDGVGNFVRVLNGKFEAANAQAGTVEQAAVLFDLTAYHLYVIVWHPFGCELWVDNVLKALLVSVTPTMALPIRLYAPVGGHLYVNSAQVVKEDEQADPLGNPFFPKDINRLISSLRPTGEVVWQSPFSNAGVPKVEDWWIYWDGAAPAPSTANDTAQEKGFVNGQSIRVETKAAANKFSGIARNFPRFKAKRIGFEVWFAIEEYTNLEYLALMIDRYDNTGYDAGLMFYELTGATAGRWKYATGSSGSYPPSSTELWSQWLYYSAAYGGKPGVPLYWHHAKLVTDFDAGKYVSFECDDKHSEQGDASVDLRTITDFRYTSPVESQIIDVAFEIRSKAAAVVKAWLGAAIVTIEEGI
jgi:hypothetical protein